MKLLIASDLHGDLASCEALIERFNGEGCDRILFLGDILYHGPRNNLPHSYNPKGVISLLNSYADKITSVRGNCDAEVDEMVLDFPVLADYALLTLDGITVFASHGHHYSPDMPPPLSEGAVMLGGHTHLYGISEFGKENIYLNPGSVSIPKGGNPKTYMIYENRSFTIKDFSENVLARVTV